MNRTNKALSTHIYGGEKLDALCMCADCGRMRFDTHETVYRNKWMKIWHWILQHCNLYERPETSSYASTKKFPILVCECNDNCRFDIVYYECYLRFWCSCDVDDAQH